MIKGLPRIFVHQNGTVTNEYDYVVDDDFEQKERTLKKLISKSCSNLKGMDYTPLRSLKDMSMRTRIIPLSRFRDDPWERVDSLNDCCRDIPHFKFIKWVDYKAKTDPYYFFVRKER